MNEAKGVIVQTFAAVAIFAIAGLVIFNSVPQKPVQTANSCGMNSSLTGEIDFDEKLALIGDQEIQIPNDLLAYTTNEEVAVLGATANPEERWIEVDLSEQKLKAWDGDNLFLETPISSGLAHTPTPTGEFRVWIKLRATKMEGGQGNYYYYLPNVPFVMFFGNDKVPNHLGYGLHGTYWHNSFGTPRSHGCVNLPTSIAEKLYYWTSPALPEGAWVSKSSAENPGTRIIIHE